MFNTIIQLISTLMGGIDSTVGETDLIYYMNEFENGSNLFYEQRVDENGCVPAIGIIKSEYNDNHILENDAVELFQEIDYKVQ